MNNNFLVFGQTSSTFSSLMGSSFDADSGIGVIHARLKCRYRFSLSITNSGDAVLVGGQINRTASRSVELLNLTKKLVIQIGPLSLARTTHGACSFGDNVVVCGGCDYSHRTTSTCEIYIPFERRWSSLPDMAKPRGSLCVVSLSRRRIFAIGGTDDTGTIESYSIVESCQLPANFNYDLQNYIARLEKPFWRNLAPMRKGRCRHAATAFQEHIIVAGGSRNIKCNLNSVEIFTPPIDDKEGGQWCSLQALMNASRCYFSLCSSPSGVFAFGGNVFSQHNTSERLQMGTSQKSGWRSCSDSTVQLLKTSTWTASSSVDIMDSILGATPMPTQFIRHWS